MGGGAMETMPRPQSEGKPTPTSFAGEELWVSSFDRAFPRITVSSLSNSSRFGRFRGRGEADGHAWREHRQDKGFGAILNDHSPRRWNPGVELPPFSSILPPFPCRVSFACCVPF